MKMAATQRENSIFKTSNSVLHTSFDVQTWTCAASGVTGCFMSTTDTLFPGDTSTIRLIKPQPLSGWHSFDPTGHPFSRHLLCHQIIVGGSSPACSGDTQGFAVLAKGMTCNFPTAHLQYHASNSPPTPSTSPSSVLAPPPNSPPRAQVAPVK